MTAAEVAAHVGGRPTGTGRWQARCPAHADRSPSLSIAEGEAGRTLVHCWAGCDTAAVLAAAGLTWRDIGGTPTTPADRAQQRREREQRQAAGAEQRRQQDSLAATKDELRERAGRIAQRLAAIEFADAAPAYAGEAEALAPDYHAALDAAHDLEAAL